MFTQILDQYKIDYLGKGNMQSSADQTVKKLDRILSQMYEDSGVCVEGEVIKGISPKILLAWNRRMISEGKEMSTRNNYIAALNPFLEWALANEYLEISTSPRSYNEVPIYKILKIGKLPREDSIPEDQRKPKSFTKEQILSLMAAIKGRYEVRDRAILALLIYSGIRESELCSLTLASVLSQPRGMIYLKRKGGSWKHTPVNDAFYPYLDAYLKQRGDLSDLTRPLFANPSGDFLSRMGLWKMVSKYEKAIGIQTGVHILRHTVISNIDKNYSAGAARDIANHSSLFMTNKYDHTTQEERREAINRLDW